jgi:hypothetical protein
VLDLLGGLNERTRSGCSKILDFFRGDTQERPDRCLLAFNDLRMFLYDIGTIPNNVGTSDATVFLLPSRLCSGFVVPLHDFPTQLDIKGRPPVGIPNGISISRNRNLFEFFVNRRPGFCEDVFEFIEGSEARPLSRWPIYLGWIQHSKRWKLKGRGFELSTHKGHIRGTYKGVFDVVEHLG